MYNLNSILSIIIINLTLGFGLFQKGWFNDGLVMLTINKNDSITSDKLLDELWNKRKSLEFML
jgi:hypothetical protein